MDTLYVNLYPFTISHKQQIRKATFESTRLKHKNISIYTKGYLFNRVENIMAKGEIACYFAIMLSKVGYNSFSHKDTFWSFCSTWLLKTLWQKEKLPIMSNVCFATMFSAIFSKKFPKKLSKLSAANVLYVGKSY